MTPAEQIKAFIAAKSAPPQEETETPDKNPETAPKPLPPTELAAAPAQPESAVRDFIEEIIIREPGAFCAFHYMFAQYCRWCRRYRLLPSRLTAVTFARAVAERGIDTNFDRQLFFGVYCRREPGQESQNGIF